LNSPIDLVTAYFTAMNARDAAAVVALFAEDGVQEDVAYGQPVGRLRLSQTLPAFFSAYPGLHYTVRSTYAEGAMVAVEYEVTNSELGDERRLRAASFFTVQDRQLLRHTAYWDEHAYKRILLP
jgi:ketosteroid isomerase-like protein